MKRITFSFILLVLLPLGLAGQQTPQLPRLSGIVHLPGIKEAVFELSSVPWDSPRQAVLSEGHEFWGVELVEIRPDWRSASVIFGTNPEPVTLTLSAQSNSVAGAADTLVLANCSLHSLLELYGQFSGRTLLIWPTLPAESFSLSAVATNPADAAGILQKALEQKQIATVPDGAKFMMVVPRNEVSSVKPHAPRSAPSDIPKPQPEEILPPGTVSWRGADINQVYFIYAELLGGKVDRSAPGPKANNPFFFLISQSPLSNGEALYALDTLFAWRGIKMVKGADGLVRPVQATQ